MMLTKVITAPSVEPITLAEAKDHLRVEHSDEDTKIESLIQASREYIETICGRALVQQTRVVLYKAWPYTEIGFVLPYPPIQSVTALKYTDTDGTEHTFSADNYSVITEREPGLLVLGYSKTWPSAVLHHDEYPIEIEYVCGYAATSDSPADYRANVPQSIKNAIKLDVEMRYDRPHEKYAERLDHVVRSLLAPYEVWW